MKDKQNRSEQQTYLQQAGSGMINLPAERVATNETNTDSPTYGEKCDSEIEEGTLVESDMTEHAQRLAVNYVRSLLLF